MITQLIPLRLAYWRQVVTDTPCPEPLCPGNREGHECVPYVQVVHQSRLPAAMHARVAPEGDGSSEGKRE